MAASSTEIARAAPRTVSASPAPVRFRPSFLALFAFFSVELLAINIARLPETMSFESFAFCDHGANLTLQYLVSHGYRPTIDFGYHYGLLPILIGRCWFGLFGATPWAYHFAMIGCDILFAWALAKTLVQLHIGAAGLAIATIAAGFAFQGSYPNLAHALEAVLLSHALAEQARGALKYALVLTSVAVFAKPSMGYVYSALLVVLIAHDLWRARSSMREWIGTFAPAALTFAIVAMLLAAIYGLRPMLQTVIPIEGFVNYRALNYGFFTGAGRELWDPSRLPWLIYLVDISGFWLASSLLLIWFGASAALELSHANSASSEAERANRAILTCAILHIAFVSLFFGNRWSWVYYSYFLVIGCAIGADLTPARRRLGIALCFVALCSWTDIVFWNHRWWQTTRPDNATAGLWAPARERDEWLKVRATARGQRTLMLDDMGATELLFQGFENPVSLYLMRGLMTPGDIDRKLAQLSAAQVVVVPITISACSGIPDAPEFRDALKRFNLAWTGKYFEVYQR